MLRELHIRNFVVIESLELQFGHGMSVFTGETGAGKSIIVDALGLIMGERADSKAVRSGKEQAEITALFDCANNTHIQALLEEQAIARDDFLMIRRVVNTDGRSRAYVNGSPVPLSVIKTLTSSLIEIHGQHAHQTLVKSDVQRTILDQFANHQDLLNELQSSYQHWFACRERLLALKTGNTDREAELSLLQYQLEELNNIAPEEREVSVLETELKRLESAEELQQSTARAAEELGLADQSCLVQLQNHQTRIQHLLTRDDKLRDIAELMDSSSAQLSEVVSQLRDYSESLAMEPERLKEVEGRLSVLHDLARKHKVHPEQLHQHWQELQSRLQGLQDSEGEYQSLSETLRTSLEKYQRLAQKLSASRSESAPKLADKIQAQIQKLGMAGANFKVNVNTIPTDEPHLHGQDKIEFLVAANPGQTAGPISKVASGGELSRISLAISVIGKTDDSAQTLIFDEVDTGIGGATAEIVGRLLHQLAKGNQVYCVTHLAQVAAFADQHYQVSKLSTRQTTQTRVSTLSKEARIEEIARMLGGVDITEQSLAHASEMLAARGSAA